MPEWWTYSLSNFLMFSPRAYYRLFELYNAAVWPLHLLALALGLAIIALALRGGPAAERVVAGALSLCWLWIAWAFFHQRYATLNWAADYVAVAFAIEAWLLLLLGLRRRARTVPSGLDRAAWVGIGLIVFAVIFHPLLGPVLGRPWRQVEVFGLAPDPTVVATLGALLVARPPGQWALMAIPVLWCLIGAATLWAMGEIEAFVLPLAALVVIATCVVGRMRRPSGEDTIGEPHNKPHHGSSRVQLTRRRAGRLAPPDWRR
jgi:Family of unknown function (DUF6064)